MIATAATVTLQFALSSFGVDIYAVTGLILRGTFFLVRAYFAYRFLKKHEGDKHAAFGVVVATMMTPILFDFTQTTVLRNPIMYLLAAVVIHFAANMIAFIVNKQRIKEGKTLVSYATIEKQPTQKLEEGSEVMTVEALVDKNIMTGSEVSEALTKIRKGSFSEQVLRQDPRDWPWTVEEVPAERPQPVVNKSNVLVLVEQDVETGRPEITGYAYYKAHSMPQMHISPPKTIVTRVELDEFATKNARLRATGEKNLPPRGQNLIDDLVSVAREMGRRRSNGFRKEGKHVIFMTGIWPGEMIYTFAEKSPNMKGKIFSS